MAYLSEYEFNNNLNSRMTTLKFEVLRATENNDMIPISSDNNVLTKDFQFDREEGPGSSGSFFGRHADYKVDLLHDNYNFSKKTDLIIRVNFLVERDSTKDLPSCNLCFTPSMEYFLNKDVYCDITFKFECGSEIKVSRLILALKSSYFRIMFEGEWVESTSSVIQIKDVKYECFKLIINHIYTNKLEKGLSFDMLKDLYLEADIRDLKLLKELVNQQIISLLNNDNLDEILLVALQTRNEHLKKFIFSYVKNNWQR